MINLQPMFILSNSVPITLSVWFQTYFPFLCLMVNIKYTQIQYDVKTNYMYIFKDLNYIIWSKTYKTLIFILPPIK